MKYKQFIYGFMIVGGLAVIYFYNQMTVKAPMKLNAQNPLSSAIPVLVSDVEHRDLKNVFTTFANLDPGKRIEIIPMKEGRVEIINFYTGDQVLPGDHIAYLYSETQLFKQRLADIELRIQQKDFNITKRLAMKKFVAKSELEEKTLRLESSKIRQKLEKIASDKTTLVSPIKGVIAELNIREGDYIAEPMKHKIVIIDPSLLKISLFLPQEVASVLKENSTVKVIRNDLSGESTANAFIDSVAPVVDRTSGTIKTVLVIPDFPKSWRSGMYVKVEITISHSPNSLAVQNQALFKENRDSFLFSVQKESGKTVARKLKVVTGMTDGQYTEIKSDLEPDGQVVIRGQGALNDQSEIDVVEMP